MNEPVYTLGKLVREGARRFEIATRWSSRTGACHTPHSMRQRCGGRRRCTRLA